MSDNTPRPLFLLRGLKSKIIAAFLLACTAIALALGITYYSFNGLLVTVDNLTTPNTKIEILNHLYQQVTQMDQLQRAAVIRNPQKLYTSLLRESQSLMSTIDTLKNLQWDAHQYQRITNIENILHKRDQLLLSYLRLRTDFVSNKKLAGKLDSLASIISWSQANMDTSVTTTERRTVTTTYPSVPSQQQEDDRSFISRLFNKKKNAPEETRIEVQEELNVTVDTVSLAQQDSSIVAIARLMKNIETGQRMQNERVVQRELELINANTNLISQLLSNLREVEAEEKIIEKSNNEQAASLVSHSIKRIGVIMIVFFLGAALLGFLILMDITRSNILRRELVKAKEDAEESGKVKQRFLANMSHEIRTPLQSILGFSEQLKNNAMVNAEAVNAIHSSSVHLLHIVNEILDISKIESGKLVIHREVFDLLQIIHEVEAAIRIQTEKKNLSFLLELDALYNLRLIGDPFRLRQILYNLLGNAVKFTEKGTVKLSVELEDSGYTVLCRFKISDTGIGMTQEELDRIFQQFEQANTTISSQYGGTGLGLYIVKKLIEAQYGNLLVESEPGNGSTFSVEMQYNKAPNIHKKPVSDVTANNTGVFKGKVLIIDDDPLILKLCKTILDKHHVDNLVYQGTREALDKPIDPDLKLILLDIRMPNVSGIDLCREFREKVGNSVKIVALTAHVLPQEKDVLLEQGFDHILTKPFREEDLLQQLGIKAPAAALPHHTSSLRMTDFSALYRMTMNDRELLHTIFTEFVEETTRNLTELEEKLANRDADAIREVIHKLAGRTGQIGAEKLSRKLKGIELELARDSGITPSLADNIFNSMISIDELLKEIQDHELTKATT